MRRRTESSVSVLVEEDERTFGAHDTQRRAYCSACVTLTLGVLGSSILPMPFAIAKTGVLVGLLTMLVVGWACDATSCMLIRAAAATGRPSYESLAEWAGGRPWKVFTQAALILLLWGTMCGGLALLSDCAVILIDRLAASSPSAGWVPPAWLTPGTCMVAVALVVLYPLCLLRHMRELETAATAGVLLVLALIGLLGAEAVRTQFPAIRDGSLPVWSLRVDKNLPSAFSVVGYAFYMQPMMMPLLREMPEGPAGIAIMNRAVHTTLYGVALSVYFSMGLFGASIFGNATADNILLNDLVSGPAATAVLYGCMLIYLALGMTTTQFALRASLDLIFAGEGAAFTWRRHVLLTTLTVGSSLAVALGTGSSAQQVFAFVGATAVCVVSYVVPVKVQLTLYSRQRGRRRQQEAAAAAPAAGDAEEASLAAALLGDAAAPQDDAVPQLAACSSASPAWGEVLHELVAPVFILCLGVGFSVAALWVAIDTALHPT